MVNIRLPNPYLEGVSTADKEEEFIPLFDDVDKEKVRKAIQKLWRHPKIFIGDKQKTSLALDFVEEELKKELGL